MYTEIDLTLKNDFLNSAFSIIIIKYCYNMKIKKKHIAMNQWWFMFSTKGKYWYNKLQN